MNIKRIWLILPGVFSPYILLLALWLIFSSSPLMDSVFGGNAFHLIGAFLAYLIVAFGLTVLALILALVQKWDSTSMAKTVMIIKLIQIPAYIVIFVLGVICFVTIFTLAFSFFFILFDLAVIAMSGMLQTAAVIAAKRKGQLSGFQVPLFILLSYIYCADVVAAVMLYVMLKKHGTASIPAKLQVV